MLYFSLAYESSKDRNLLFFIQICSLAQDSPEEARTLFEYFLNKDKFGEIDTNLDEILEILESKFYIDTEIEEQDAISYEDFKRAVAHEGSFKRVFENIMFSTRVMISKKDDFLEFLQDLIKNNFLEMSMNYLESAAVMFSGDERIDMLLKEIQKRRSDENLH
ncbi:histidine kinase [Campylobacter sp. faydin G-24]|uniref:Histidine kinase n=1 Tax=Campylobacter anatolicus TaxID=2829105 RepID=A0ABS5HK46_9BACT|nr:histidine kinase [Campylobacter anatolicus]MBR8461588.1 histidine kinase [Campylobacter anatolicus]MBR8464650.1 histidine kinase [Campylobacter anatolicus]MBR8465319.1 histidine kinase [Campylobacter anatolicus]